MNLDCDTFFGKSLTNYLNDVKNKTSNMGGIALTSFINFQIYSFIQSQGISDFSTPFDRVHFSCYILIFSRDAPHKQSSSGIIRRKIEKLSAQTLKDQST